MTGNEALATIQELVSTDSKELEDGRLINKSAEAFAVLRAALLERDALKAEVGAIMAGRYCLCETCREHRRTVPRGEEVNPLQGTVDALKAKVEGWKEAHACANERWEIDHARAEKAEAEVERLRTANKWHVDRHMEAVTRVEKAEADYKNACDEIAVVKADLSGAEAEVKDLMTRLVAEVKTSKEARAEVAQLKEAAMVVLEAAKENPLTSDMQRAVRYLCVVVADEEGKQ